MTKPILSYQIIWYVLTRSNELGAVKKWHKPLFQVVILQFALDFARTRIKFEAL